MTEGMAHRPVWDLGRPGASARAEFERRRRHDQARRQAVFGRVLAPVVGALAGPNPSTVAWQRGGQGEEQVGRFLSQAVGQAGIVLHDRSLIGSRANIDHIAVVPSGVWVIDTKRHRGKVEQRGGWFRANASLIVNHHDRTNLVNGAVGQRQLVQRAVGPKVAVRSVLCFTDAEWGFMAKPFHINEVLVTWPRRLSGALAGGGPLDRAQLEGLAATLSEAFPPYAPSGTSHNPTGAWPRG
jgi:hypothetical protein